MERKYEFDDILIVPKYSKVVSREEPNTTTMLRTVLNTFIELDVPIIASPMKGIVGTRLIKELGRLGGLGILHRFYNSLKDRTYDLENLERSGVSYGVAIGAGGSYGDESILADIYKGKYNPKVICVDVANGYNQATLDYVKHVSYGLRYLGLPISLMAGNVVTVEGVKNLSKAGATLYRIGIGSGQLCTTRNKTGIGYPQFSALREVYEYSMFGHIADGGIKNSGDIVKALSAGASAVMMGTLLASTKESDNNGTIYGMASKQLQKEFYGTFKSVEGVSKPVEVTTTLRELVEDITWSIKSACTYLDAMSLAGLRRNAQFVRVGSGSIIDK